MNMRRNAFTLVELLVVVAIMALLIGIAIPSLTGARTAAKRTATQAQIRAIDTGLELFRSEQGLGGRLPPSASDITLGTNAGMISDPQSELTGGTQSYVRITGASLLVYALSGPDNNGTAGFRPPLGASYWADETGGAGTDGLYDPDPSNRPVAPRYGPYGGAELMESVSTLRAYSEKHSDFVWGELSGSAGAMNQRVYVDKFDSPILYYRARTAAPGMIYDPNSGLVGIYDHRDNAPITGGRVHSAGTVVSTGIHPPNKEHLISGTYYKGDSGYLKPFIAPPAPDDYTPLFDMYILDMKSSTQNPKPIRADSYLLISAGADRLFGTNDDVTNWKN